MSEFNWTIKTKTPEQAVYATNFGAIGGFVWCGFILLSLVIHWLSNSDWILWDDPEIQMLYGEKAIIVLIALILSMFVLVKRSLIAALSLLVFFIFYKILLIMGGHPIYRGILGNLVLLYMMYAGVRGTYAWSMFKRQKNVDPDVFN